MTRHIAWQAALAFLGVVLVFVILFQLASTSPTTPVTVEVPAEGGTYVEGILGFSETINPVLAPPMIQANPIDQDLSTLVFDGLTSLDTTGQVSPSLAIDWEVSEDGTEYVFQLREDVTWHDGAPFTADDVAFTVQAVQDPNFQGDPALRELWRSVKVAQTGDHTVRFVLEEAFPSFLLYTTMGILPSHLLSDVPAADLAGHDFSTQRPVGTGQFMVESVSSDRIVLAANPNYWGPRPLLDKLEFWLYGDWDGMLADLEAGELHGVHPLRLRDLSTLTGMPELQFYSAPSAGYGTIYLNLQRESVPFLQETGVRQALLYALDRENLLAQTLEGQGLVADSPIVPFSWAHDPTVRQYRYDPERAIGLLDASGWQDSDGDRVRDKDGIELSFTLLISDDPAMVQLAEEVVGQWQAVGVDAQIRSASTEAVSRFVHNRNFDAALIEIGLTADPDPYPLWHSTQAASGQNFSGFANEEADLLMEEGRLTTDPDRRLELIQAFQKMFAEQVPAVLLYYPIYTYAADTEVQGMQISPLLHPSDRFRNIQDWYLETEEIVVTELDSLDKRDE